jgi:hypothetical protein
MSDYEKASAGARRVTLFYYSSHEGKTSIYPAKVRIGLPAGTPTRGAGGKDSHKQ